MTSYSNSELPAWLLARVEQRMALLKDKGADLLAGQPDMQTVIMMPLTEPLDDDIEKWERMCDACGTHTPNNQNFYTGHIARDFGDVTIAFVLGVCDKHKF